MKLKYLSATGALIAAFGQLPVHAQGCDTLTGDARPLLLLEDAVARALEADLRPVAAQAAIAAARTDRAIAALRPAGSVSLEVENFPGTGIASGTGSLEVTGRFSRIWERGGKRQARAALADTGVEIAEAGAAISAADIAYEVETLFIELALAVEHARLAEARRDAARAAEGLIARRVEAARDPLLAGARAAADALSAEGNVARLNRDAEALRRSLAAFWGGAPDFSASLCSLTDGNQHTDHPVDVDTSPELARIEAERRRAQAGIRAAEASRVPDVTWSAGVRKFGTDEGVALLGGISIPLGSANQATPYEQKSAAEARQLEAEGDALRQSLLREAARLERAALGALDTLTDLETGPIPEAERAVSLANDGYARGAFAYFDVLDAQRLLFDLREQRLDHLRTYHLAEAALARIQAANVPAIFRETAQ